MKSFRNSEKLKFRAKIAKHTEKSMLGDAISLLCGVEKKPARVFSLMIFAKGKMMILV